MTTVKWLPSLSIHWDTSFLKIYFKPHQHRSGYIGDGVANVTLRWCRVCGAIILNNWLEVTIRNNSHKVSRQVSNYRRSRPRMQMRHHSSFRLTGGNSVSIVNSAAPPPLFACRNALPTTFTQCATKFKDCRMNFYPIYSCTIFLLIMF